MTSMPSKVTDCRCGLCLCGATWRLLSGIDEDAVFGESNGLNSGVNLIQKLTQSFVAAHRWCADWIVADRVCVKGIDPAFYIHGTECGEVFGNGLRAGGWRSESVL
jgi:hypothetical protein